METLCRIATLSFLLWSPVYGFLLPQSPARRSLRLNWQFPLGSSSDAASDLSYYETQDTLLRIHLAPLQEDALEQTRRFIQSFPYAVVLPTQPLALLPTADGGVDLKFFRRSVTNRVVMDGGLRIFVKQDQSRAGDGERIVVTAKRNERGQLCVKLEEEKAVMTSLITSWMERCEGKGQGMDAAVGTMLGATRIESVYHKWMLDNVALDLSSTILYDETQLK